MRQVRWLHHLWLAAPCPCCLLPGLGSVPAWLGRRSSHTALAGCVPPAAAAAAHPLAAVDISPSASYLPTAGLSAQAKAPPCASITAGAVLPAAAAVAATPAQLPLAGLARDMQQAILVAAAAARSTVLVSRGTAAPLHRRRAKPASKAKASSGGGESATTTAAVAQPAALATAVASPRTAATTAAPAAAAASSQQQRALHRFVAGGLAGAVSKTLVAPMERVSTLLMTDAQRRFSLAAAAQHAWRDGLYRGHAATLVKVRLEGWGCRFFCAAAAQAVHKLQGPQPGMGACGPGLTLLA